MLGIDDHVLSLVRYSMQGDLLSFVVGGKHIVQSNNCHISADILCGNRVLTAGIRDEAVFLYPAQIYFVYDILAFERAEALFFCMSKTAR